jgi:hypothetical protein
MPRETTKQTTLQQGSRDQEEVCSLKRALAKSGRNKSGGVHTNQQELEWEEED